MSIRTLSSRAVLVAALATGCASNKEVEHVETLRRDLASASAVMGSIKPQLPADVTLNKDAGRRSYLFVTISLETGEKLPFIVDTGSPVTFFRKSLEPKLGKRVGTIEVWSPGIGGMRRTKGGVFKAPQLQNRMNAGHGNLQLSGESPDPQPTLLELEHFVPASGECAWPAQLDATLTGGSQAGVDPFTDDTALKLGDSHRDRELELPARAIIADVRDQAVECRLGGKETHDCDGLPSGPHAVR